LEVLERYRNDPTFRYSVDPFAPAMTTVFRKPSMRTYLMPLKFEISTSSIFKTYSPKSTFLNGVAILQLHRFGPGRKAFDKRRSASCNVEISLRSRAPTDLGHVGISKGGL
jgi:hypothetical protein